MGEFKGPIVEGAYYACENGDIHRVRSRDEGWLYSSDGTVHYCGTPYYQRLVREVFITHTDPAEVVAELREKCNAATEKRDEFEGVNTVAASWHGGHLTGFAEAANLVAEKLGGTVMTQPETKTVLGRVFHATSDGMEWLCKTNQGEVVLLPLGEHWSANFEVTIGFTRYRVAKAFGPTESDAILALQSTLRKMAELEVSGG